MRIRFGLLGSVAGTVVALAAMVVPAGAGATVTIGSLATTDPGAVCKAITEPVFLAQVASESFSYAVPAGGGIITSWSTSFGESGAPMSLVVLRNTATARSYEVVGGDSETLPTPISANHISTFELASPIVVQAGDFLGLQTTPGSGSACAYKAGAGNKVELGHAGSLTPGATLVGASEPPELLLNLSATVVQSVDLSLSESISPESGPPGLAVITLVARDLGPAAVPATITDVVPSGLHVLAAGVAGGGECTVAGQGVTCELNSVPLTPGEAIADIVVSSSAPGSYSNQASIAASLADSNPANNTAGATLTVVAPAPVSASQQCEVLALTGTPESVAEAVIKALHCTVGKVEKKASKTVAKGLVIDTTPKAGVTLAAGSAVNVIVSSGPPKKAKKSKKGKKGKKKKKK